MCCFSACFHKNEPIGIGECLTFLRGDGTPMLHIIFVANEHDDHVALTVLTCLLQPSRQMREGISPRNVIDEQGSCSSTIVGSGNGSERFLPSSVPNLQSFLFVFFVGNKDAPNNPTWWVLFQPLLLRSSSYNPLVTYLTSFSSRLIMRAPNSTPIVKSCTGWNRLSVNWSNRHDLPTPWRGTNSFPAWKRKTSDETKMTQWCDFREQHWYCIETNKNEIYDTHLCPQWWYTWKEKNKTSFWSLTVAVYLCYGTSLVLLRLLFEAMYCMCSAVANGSMERKFVPSKNYYIFCFECVHVEHVEVKSSPVESSRTQNIPVEFWKSEQTTTRRAGHDDWWRQCIWIFKIQTSHEWLVETKNKEKIFKRKKSIRKKPLMGTVRTVFILA